MNSKEFLRKHKIVSVHPSSGELILERGNLKNFFASQQSYIGTARVRIICVLGESKSGKSLMTNLLIQRYQCEGEDWLDNLVCDVNSDRGRRLLGKATTDQSEEGVYLWPKLFYPTKKSTDKHGEVQSVVCILYVIHRPRQPTRTAAADLSKGKVLERFVATACSRVVEVVEKHSRRLHFVDVMSDIIAEGGDMSTLCHRVLYILRSERSLSNTQVQTKMEHIFPQLNTNLQTSHEFTSFRNHVSTKLHDTNTGSLNQAAVTSLETVLCSVVKTITRKVCFPKKKKIKIETDEDDSEHGTGDNVTVGNLLEHFETCVYIINKTFFKSSYHQASPVGVMHKGSLKITGADKLSENEARRKLENLDLSKQTHPRAARSISKMHFPPKLSPPPQIRGPKESDPAPQKNKSISLVIRLKKNSVTVSINSSANEMEWSQVAFESRDETSDDFIYNPQKQAYLIGPEAATYIKSYMLRPKSAWKFMQLLCSTIKEAQSEPRHSKLLLRFLQTLQPEVSRKTSGSFHNVLFLVPDYLEDLHKERLSIAATEAFFPREPGIITESFAIACTCFEQRGSVAKSAIPIFIFSHWRHIFQITAFGIDKNATVDNLTLSIQRYSQVRHETKKGQVSIKTVATMFIKFKADFEMECKLKRRLDLVTSLRSESVIFAESEASRATIHDVLKDHPTSIKILTENEMENMVQIVMMGAKLRAVQMQTTPETLKDNHREVEDNVRRSSSVSDKPFTTHESMQVNQPLRRPRPPPPPRRMMSEPPPLPRLVTCEPSYDIGERQKALLKKCQRMKNAVDNGKVTITIDFLKKSVLEQIDSAAQLGSKAKRLVILDEIVEMEQMLDDLIKLYSFPST